jgi:hypothetical protein
LAIDEMGAQLLTRRFAINNEKRLFLKLAQCYVR